MNKTDCELFKDALREGLSRRIDSIASSYEGEVLYSKKHETAMRAIISGKHPKAHRLPNKFRRIVAIVAILALLLASCAVIYRDEIKALKEKIFAKYDWLTYSEEYSDYENTTIEEVYELTYLPEGYFLKDSYISTGTVSIYYEDANGNTICFDQDPIHNLHVIVDNEEGYQTTIQIDKYTIHHRQVKDKYMYMWNDGKYVFSLLLSFLPNEDELLLILDGVKIK